LQFEKPFMLAADPCFQPLQVMAEDGGIGFRGQGITVLVGGNEETASVGQKNQAQVALLQDDAEIIAQYRQEETVFQTLFP